MENDILKIFKHTNVISDMTVRDRGLEVVRGVRSFEESPFICIKNIDKINLFYQDFYFIQQNLFECYNFFQNNYLLEVLERNKLNRGLDRLPIVGRSYGKTINTIQVLDIVLDKIEYYMSLRDYDQITTLINGVQYLESNEGKLIMYCCSTLVSKNYKEGTKEYRAQTRKGLELMIIKLYKFDETFGNFISEKTGLERILREPIIIKNHNIVNYVIGDEI